MSSEDFFWEAYKCLRIQQDFSIVPTFIERNAIKTNHFIPIVKEKGIYKIYKSTNVLTEYYKIDENIALYPTEISPMTIYTHVFPFNRKNYEKEIKRWTKSIHNQTYIKNKFKQRIFLEEGFKNNIKHYYYIPQNPYEQVSDVKIPKEIWHHYGIEEFRYHPDIGIIGGTYKTIMERLGIDTGGKMFELKTVNGMSMEEYLKTIERN